MKSWACVLSAVALAVAGCSAAPTRATLPTGRVLAPRFLRVQVSTGGRAEIRQVPLEDYVRATIISEFAPAAGETALVERMLEVQAVISRTYALAHLDRHGREGFDLCSTTHCQLFEPERVLTSRWASASAAAIERTGGQVLWYDRGPVNALFHADCGGHTSRSSDVWAGTGQAYLVGAADDGPADDAHSTWQFDATIVEIRNALNADPRTRVGSQFDGLTVLDRDDAGRAQRIALHSAHDRIVRGEELREVLSRSLGPRSIKSTWFDVRRDRNVIHFEGRGYGHGVGLCQAGAFARLRAGARMSVVLLRYFPGTKLVTVN